MSSPVSFGNFGMTSYGNEQKESIDYSGILQMQGTTVIGHTRVMGMLNCINAKLNTAELSGNIKVVNTEFNGNVSVKGMLEATNSVFKSSLTVQSKCLTITDTKTKSITLQPNPDTPQQVVHLSGSSHVDGDITFESGNGQVNVAPTATIAGEVIGGAKSNL